MLSDARDPSFFYESQSQNQQDDPRNNRNNKTNDGEQKKKYKYKKLIFPETLDFLPENLLYFRITFFHS